MSFKGCTRRAALRFLAGGLGLTNLTESDLACGFRSLSHLRERNARPLSLTGASPVTSRSWRNRYATNTIRLVGADYRAPRVSLQSTLSNADLPEMESRKSRKGNERHTVSRRSLSLGIGKARGGIVVSGPTETR